jgi:hypothetical protein
MPGSLWIGFKWLRVGSLVNTVMNLRIIQETRNSNAYVVFYTLMAVAVKTGM